MNILLHWILPISMSVGVTLFGFWMGYCSRGNEIISLTNDLDHWLGQLKKVQEELKYYTSKIWPVSYYCNSADNQAFQRYALLSHASAKIEEINILNPSIFMNTIALAVRDHGFEVRETATEIKVLRKVEPTAPALEETYIWVLKKETKEK